RTALSAHLPLFALPAALRAFSLWLSATQEIDRREFTREDLLHFALYSLPLVKVLTFAASPIPTINHAALGEWQEVRTHHDKPLGEALAYMLRYVQDGAVARLTALGHTFPMA